MNPESEYIRCRGRGHAPCFSLWPDYRLHLSSYLQQNSQNLQKTGKATRKYPDGSSEITIYPMPHSDGDGTTPRPKDEGAAFAPTVDRDIAQESAARAARKVRRVARYARMRNMLTLTFPGGGVHDYKQAYGCVSRYLHRDGNELRDRGGYIVVFELHPGGHGYHGHVLFPGPRLPVDSLRRQRSQWTRHVRECGLADGHEGVVRTHVKRFSSERRAAIYASKYVTKTFEGDDHVPGRHRYLRSEGVDLPAPVYEAFPDWSLALASCPHPLFWDEFFDARPTGRPFIWLAWAPDG